MDTGSKLNSLGSHDSSQNWAFDLTEQRIRPDGGNVTTSSHIVFQLIQGLNNQIDRLSFAPRIRGLENWRRLDTHDHQDTVQREQTSGSGLSEPSIDSALIEELKQKTHALETCVSSLTSERDHLEAKLHEQTMHNTQLQVQLRQQGWDVSELKEQAAKLRMILTSHTRDDSEPLDDTVIKRFRRLRDSVFKIVQRHCQHSATLCLDSRAESFHRQKKWFPLSDLAKIDQSGRVRAMVYELLYEHILGTTCFGLDREVEEALSKFEGLLKHYFQDNKASEISDWRKCTIQCARWFKMSEQRSNLAATKIWNCLLPWLPPAGATNSATNGMIFGEIKALCDNALEFALTLRGSKSRYLCYSFREGDRVDDSEDSDMMVQGLEGPQRANAKNAQVAFTIFGALWKLDDLNPKEHLTLEKAHVIARA